MPDLGIAGVEPFQHDPNTDPRDGNEDQQQPTRYCSTPPGDEVGSTQADHYAHCSHQHQQHTSSPRCGDPFQPTQIIDRSPPGLRRRHFEGRDFLEILIKKRSGTITNDAHRVREAISGIGVFQQLIVVSPAYEMRDKIRKPCDCDGSENYASRTHTQTVRFRLHSSGDLERCVARNECDGCGQRCRRFSQRRISPSGTSSAFRAKTR